METNSANQCVYCGTPDGLTADHVPPGSLFPKPRPSDLLTVLSCSRCNNGESKHDEYFRDTLATRADAGNTQAGRNLWPRIKRSFERPQASAFTHSLATSIRSKELFTDAGLFVGTAPTLLVDSRRIRRVVARITRGLHYIHLQQVLPFSHNVRVYGDDDLRHDAKLETLVGTIITHTTESPNHAVGDGSVFNYWLKQNETDSSICSWVMCFYQSVYFVSFNHPE